MSFGWSVGDLIAAIQILVQISAALKEADGAPAKYHESSEYLESVVRVLTTLKNSGPTAPQADVEALLTHISVFHKKLKDRFEEDLGRDRKKDWKSWVGRGPKKIQYAFFVVDQVQALRDRIDSQLHTISLWLGLETFHFSRDAVSLLKEGKAVQERAALPKVGQWLNPLPVVDKYNDILAGMRPDSCKWLFKKAHYVQWADKCQEGGQLPVLWVSGIPGCGKTRLATAAAQRLGGKVGYFYCDKKDSSRRNIEGILPTWTWQILQNDLGKLGPIVKIMENGASPNETNLIECLRCLLYEGCDCTLILDGLDECEEDTQRKFLDRFLVVLSKNAKLMLFSQEVNEISLRLYKRRESTDLVHLRVSDIDIESDMKAFLEEKVRSLEVEDQDLEAKVVSSLLSGAKGMFLWAALMVEELSNPVMDLEEDYNEALKKLLQDLPRDLDDLYARFLAAHASKKSWQLSQTFFQWLTCSTIPLSLEELGAVIKIDVEDTSMKHPLGAKKIRSAISKCCSPLIKFDELVTGATTVTLIHASLKDYLLRCSVDDVPFKTLLVNEGETHMLIGRSCLRYICYDEIGYAPFGPLSGGSYYLGETFDKMDDIFEGHLMRYPFLRWAARNWRYHCGKAFSLGSGNVDKIQQLEGYLESLYQSERNVLKVIQLFHRLCGDRGRYQTSTAQQHDLEPLYAFAQALREKGFPGFWNLLARLESSTPWQIPFAFFDFDEFVGSSLAEGADVDLPTHAGQTLLSMAAYGDSAKTAAVLLRAGARVNTRTFHNNIALHWSIQNYDWEIGTKAPFEVVHLLLRAGSDTCLLNDDEATPLNLACLFSYPGDPRIDGLVELLLNHGATKVIDVGTWYPPLQMAARRGAATMVQLLLRSGATVDAVLKGNSTALLAVCSNPRVSLRVIQLLLTAGASTKATISDGRSAVHLVARGSIEAAKLLIEHGAPLNLVAKDGSLPLHDAARARNCDLIRMILKGGSDDNSDLDKKDGTGRTALEIALDSGYLDVAKPLVAAGASCDGERWLTAMADKKLKVRRKDGVYWPQDPRDVYEVYGLLRYHKRLRNLARSVHVQIMDMAEYWTRSSSSRSDKVEINDRDAELQVAYLTSSPIVGTTRAPVRRITFTTLSHDQGHSSYPQDHGSYDNSWTWFDLNVIQKDGRRLDFESESKQLVVNVHASGNLREHRVIYGDRPGMCQTKWMSRLEPGDAVSIVPMARFPGWVNYVYGASIEIFTSPLID